MPVLRSVALPASNAAVSAATSSASGGRRKARWPKDMMNAWPQASTAAAPVVVGAHGTRLAQVVLTAVIASDSAAFRYCSASTGDTLSAWALLSKPRLTSSAGKLSAGAEV